MDFASKYVYDYENSDEECVSEDELEHGMTLSDDESDYDELAPRAVAAAAVAYDNVGETTKDPVVADAAVYDNAEEQRYEEIPGGGPPLAGGAPPPPPPLPPRSGGFFSSFFSSLRGSSSKPKEHASAPKPGQLKSEKKKKKMSHWRSVPAAGVTQANVQGKKFRRADTNVVSIKFQTLTSPSHMHTGDPVSCSKCQALLSHISKLHNQGEDQVWTCEFCGEGNIVDLVPEEMPQKEDVTYMIQPAPVTTASGKSGADESVVIFVVDTSGSMCVTTEVPGKVNLRGRERLSRLQSFNERHEDQHLPGQRHDVTYVSRLQGVQAAVAHQLAELEKDHPNRRVALIEFNNEVRGGPPLAGGAPPPPPPLPPRSGGFFSSFFSSLRGSSSKPKEHASAPKPGQLKSEKKKKKMSHWRSVPAAGVTQANVQGKKFRRADTNVVSIKFQTLTSPSHMHTGDPVSCSKCQALLSHISKLHNQGEDQVWTCEFCGEGNIVDLVPEEMPQKEDVTYMIQPAPVTTASGKSGADESVVIFVVDTSGSMCVTTEVPGKVNLRGRERLSRLQSFNERHEDQHLPGQRHDVTYVSRLQGVQAAVAHQLAELEKDHPNRRVALIEFNNEVTVIGDGSGTPITVTGDKLTSKDALVDIASDLQLPKNVKDTRQNLDKKVFDLEEGGGTALGPALLIAVAMASKYTASKVIICTDGMANVGLGRLDEENSQEAAEEFYTEVGQMAVDKGVGVSVITIKGTDCKLVELGKVADTTGGQVNIVDPLKLTQEFGSILADPIIATNVTATFILHKGLYIRDEESKESRATKFIGNVTVDTEVTFEYGVRHQKKQKKEKKNEEEGKEEVADAQVTTEKTESEAGAEVGAEAGPKVEAGAGAKVEAEAGDEVGAETGAKIGAEAGPSTGDAGVGDLSELPFQLQIKYTDLEGSQAMRVLTQSKPITKDRNVAEREMNLQVIGAHTAQTTARLALQGDYTASRLNAFTKQRLVSRHTKTNTSARAAYRQFFCNIAPIEQTVNAQLQSERQLYGGSTHSDDEMDEVSEVAEACVSAPPNLGNKKGKKGLKKLKSRKAECNDALYEQLFKAQRSKSEAFSTPKSDG
ncbi:uncharacterized protein LOC106178153 [Lingula anatina]|uniref:Uncharacterized protein LOC106178153 n=1 Tax=Lingula anatina TaxID=7574 RepID=A0A1S3K210_LINAN|nr:uncharacterized protein LOC106178153 [Lingula anatina]|eukprot:XP_013416673.1 uncharacterized protein LOC106178153 [Lingula anatina]